MDVQDVRRAEVRVQPDVVAAEAPVEALPAYEVLDVERGWQTRLVGHDDDALLDAVRIDVDDGEDRVAPEALEVGDQRLVLRLQEVHVGQVLQGRVLAPDAV